MFQRIDQRFDRRGITLPAQHSGHLINVVRVAASELHAFQQSGDDPAVVCLRQDLKLCCRQTPPIEFRQRSLQLAEDADRFQSVDSRHLQSELFGRLKLLKPRGRVFRFEPAQTAACCNNYARLRVVEQLDERINDRLGPAITSRPCGAPSHVRLRVRHGLNHRLSGFQVVRFAERPNCRSTDASLLVESSLQQCVDHASFRSVRGKGPGGRDTGLR